MIPKKKNIAGHWRLNGLTTASGLLKDFSGNGNYGTIVGTGKIYRIELYTEEKDAMWAKRKYEKESKYW